LTEQKLHIKALENIIKNLKEEKLNIGKVYLDEVDQIRSTLNSQNQLVQQQATDLEDLAVTISRKDRVLTSLGQKEIGLRVLDRKINEINAHFNKKIEHVAIMHEKEKKELQTIISSKIAENEILRSETVPRLNLDGVKRMSTLIPSSRHIGRWPSKREIKLRKSTLERPSNRKYCIC